MKIVTLSLPITLDSDSGGWITDQPVTPINGIITITPPTGYAIENLALFRNGLLMTGLADSTGNADYTVNASKTVIVPLWDTTQDSRLRVWYRYAPSANPTPAIA